LEDGLNIRLWSPPYLFQHFFGWNDDLIKEECPRPAPDDSFSPPAQSSLSTGPGVVNAHPERHSPSFPSTRRGRPFHYTGLLFLPLIEASFLFPTWRSGFQSFFVARHVDPFLRTSPAYVNDPFLHFLSDFASSPPNCCAFAPQDWCILWRGRSYQYHTARALTFHFLLAPPPWALNRLSFPL